MKQHLIICAAVSVLLLTALFSPIGPAQALETPTVDVTYQIPANIPPKEQKWYKTFHEGNLGVDGWLDISRDILSKLPAAQQPEQQVSLMQLGDKIGREWAKDNRTRKIDTGMLRKWGKELKDASEQGPLPLTRAIASINRQVDTILR